MLRSRHLWSSCSAIDGLHFCSYDYGIKQTSVRSDMGRTFCSQLLEQRKYWQDEVRSVCSRFCCCSLCSDCWYSHSCGESNTVPRWQFYRPAVKTRECPMFSVFFVTPKGGIDLFFRITSSPLPMLGSQSHLLIAFPVLARIPVTTSELFSMLEAMIPP